MTELNDIIENTTPESCYYEQGPMTNFRFWLVAVFGSSVAIISVISNVILFYLFSTRKHHRSSFNVYMLFLAFFDIVVSFFYILLMSVNVAADYFLSTFLVNIWFWYMTPIITISHIAIVSSSFLIVAASYEIYCVTVKSRHPFAQSKRLWISTFAILLGIVSKASVYFEFELHDTLVCAGTMSATQIGYKDFVFGTPYHVLWKFWYCSVVIVFVPFLILVYLNIRIMMALTAHTNLNVGQRAANEILENACSKENQRSVARTLVMFVLCYHVSNIINLILPIFEHFDMQTLISSYVDAYTIAVDLASLLTVLACACRLPIYLACQEQIRSEVWEILSNLRRNLQWETKKEMIPHDELHKNVVISQESNEPLLETHVNALKEAPTGYVATLL